MDFLSICLMTYFDEPTKDCHLISSRKCWHLIEVDRVVIKSCKTDRFFFASIANKNDKNHNLDAQFSNNFRLTLLII